VKAKTLFWLLVIGALFAVAYVWAWPQFQNRLDPTKGHDPHTVVINMPTPVG
jgi:hypothetical protein